MAPYESGATGDDYVTLEAVHIFLKMGMSANLGQICGHFLTIIVIILLNDTLFKIFGEVGAHAFAGTLYSHLGHVGVGHYLHQFGERCLLRVPAEFCAGLCGVAPEIYHVGRTVEVGRYLDKHLAGSRVDTLFVLFLTFPAQFDADVAESKLAEFAHGVLLAGGDNEVLGSRMLENEPHTLHIVLGIAPVAQRREVAEIELVLLPWAIRAAARVILRVTKVSPRRSLSWLKRIPEQQYMP